MPSHRSATTIWGLLLLLDLVSAGINVLTPTDEVIICPRSVVAFICTAEAGERTAHLIRNGDVIRQSTNDYLVATKTYQTAMIYDNLTNIEELSVSCVYGSTIRNITISIMQTKIFSISVTHSVLFSSQNYTVFNVSWSHSMLQYVQVYKVIVTGVKQFDTTSTFDEMVLSNCNSYFIEITAIDYCGENVSASLSVNTSCTNEVTTVKMDGTTLPPSSAKTSSWLVIIFIFVLIIFLIVAAAAGIALFYLAKRSKYKKEIYLTDTEVFQQRSSEDNHLASTNVIPASSDTDFQSSSTNLNATTTNVDVLHNVALGQLSYEPQASKSQLSNIFTETKTANSSSQTTKEHQSYPGEHYLSLLHVDEVWRLIIAKIFELKELLVGFLTSHWGEKTEAVKKIFSGMNNLVMGSPTCTTADETVEKDSSGVGIPTMKETTDDGSSPMTSDNM